jgi:hypothetical protein
MNAAEADRSIRVWRVEISASRESTEVNILPRVGMVHLRNISQARAKKDPIRPSPRLRTRDFRCRHPGTHVAGAINLEEQ